jgi:hypothetical protein
MHQQQQQLSGLSLVYCGNGTMILLLCPLLLLILTPAVAQVSFFGRGVIPQQQCQQQLR